MDRLFLLLKKLNTAGGNFDPIYSGVTELIPGYKGMAERFAYIYNRDHIKIGQVASDLSLDRTAVLTNISKACQLAYEA